MHTKTPAQVREYITDKLGGVGPRFVGILANTDPAARKYAEWTGRACMKDGIRYEVCFLLNTFALYGCGHRYGSDGISLKRGGPLCMCEL